MYQNLRLVLPSSQRFDSVHYEMLPEPRAEAFNETIENAVNAMQVCKSTDSGGLCMTSH